ncbi:MAG: peptidase [Rhizobiales bacterium]|nr:peptidase [Hyphomicrobiales bacterium]
MRKYWLELLTATALTLAAFGSGTRANAATAEDVNRHYVAMAQAMYGDAYASALTLQSAINAFLAAPSPETLSAARAAWVETRHWYQRTEGFRFGNPAVDDLEGRVNSWPLDEGFIDYIAKVDEEASEENPLYAANVIANKKVRIGNEDVDLTDLTTEKIAALQEADGNEANVAIGYHAIEFLLWGQDLNGTGPGAGNRPYTDYDLKNCTGGNCDRRAAYLKGVTDLLVADSKAMKDIWEPDGKANKDFTALGGREGLGVILTGLGSLSYGELAGERMKLGLILHDPEEEHDCFSDNTQNSHFDDQAGMVEIYTGTVKRLDGTTLEGPGIQELAAAEAPEQGQAMDKLMADTLARMQALKDRAETGKEAYDQMIAAGNSEGNAAVQAAIDALVAQTHGVEALVAAMKLSIKVEGSDSLDDPAKVNTP